MRSRNNDRTLTVASIASIAALVVLVVLLALAARDADAQPPVRHPAPGAQPAATPAIGADSARAIALAHVAGAAVTSERLRTRHGHELYLFTLAVEGRKDPVRATVDAATGAFTRLDGAAGAPAETRPPARPAATPPPAGSAPGRARRGG